MCTCVYYYSPANFGTFCPSCPCKWTASTDEVPAALSAWTVLQLSFAAGPHWHVQSENNNNKCSILRLYLYFIIIVNQLTVHSLMLWKAGWLSSLKAAPPLFFLWLSTLGNTWKLDLLFNCSQTLRAINLLTKLTATFILDNRSKRPITVLTYFNDFDWSFLIKHSVSSLKSPTVASPKVLT